MRIDNPKAIASIRMQETGGGTDLLTISANPLSTSRSYIIPDAGAAANFVVSPSTAAQGDVLYYDGTTWVSLIAGNSGYFLQTQGSGKNPKWAAAGGGSGGYQTIWLPVGGGISSITAGAFLGDREYTNNYVNIDVAEFSPSVEQFIEYSIVLDDTWDQGTVKAKFFWTYEEIPLSGTGVEWGIQATAKSDHDAIDSAWGSEVTVADTILAVNDLHVTSASGAITIAGVYTTSNLINIRVSRNISSINDDLSCMALLIGTLIQYNVTSSGSSW